MMQSALIWTRAVPLSGCWVHSDGSPGDGRLCAPSFHHSCPGSAHPRAAEMNRPIQAGKLGLWSWGSWAFTALRSGILPVTSYWELWIPAKIMDGHYLNSEGFEQSLWLSCICHTRSDPQCCNSSCSAPCRTDPLTNPPKSKSIDFQSNPPGFLIYISWTSCLLKLSLFALVFNQSWFWAMNMIRFSYQEGMKVWR